jgi:hypothetical protein
VIGKWRDKLYTILESVRRTTSAFFLLRGALYLTTLGALLTAAPHPLVASRWVLGLIVVALLPALLPRTGAVTLVLVAAVTLWLAATTVYGESVGYLRLVVLATLLYVTHVLAAVSAAIPNDAVVAPRTLLSWLPRTGILVVITALVALGGAALPRLLGGERFLVASLVGLVITGALGYYLARLVNRS